MKNFLIVAVFLAGLSCPQPAWADDPADTGQATSAAPQWAFETSDIEPDPAFVFGKLDNGLRYIIRENDRPEGTALVRMRIGSGSLSEQDDERGLAHFLEHMAFNGSSRVPEGEMIKLLEREGLAFGADTNASTGFEDTTYKLDLPRNDPDLLDTALMLMRETASELTLSRDAIDRERGVILAERRDRNTYSLQELIDRLEFATPGALHTRRLPIGVPEVLENVTTEQMRAFYAREYVPANTVLVVVGDIAGGTVEKAIRRHFASWPAAPLPADPEVGVIDLGRGGETDIYLDPALSERITVSRHLPWVERHDSSATRRENLLRSIGYDIVNRRLGRLASLDDAPFRSAGFGTGDVFDSARTTSLVVSTPDGGWKRGLDAATDALRTALRFGFSEREVAEQIARSRNAIENAVSAAETRSNGALVGAALALVEDKITPSTPEDSLTRFESYAETITPDQVLEALLADSARLDNPLIRFRGRQAPRGGSEELRAAWETAVARPVQPPEIVKVAEFAYTDFGAPGQVVADTKDDRLSVRKITFGNGVRLNLKRTDLSKDRISFRMNIDGGDLLDTKDNPNGTAMINFFTAGGLGAHSRDELATILAGRSVGLGFSSLAESFRAIGTTTQRDLLLQLRLLTAGLTDPGYRPEGESRYRRSVANFYRTLDATPGRAYSSAAGSILSDGDPRFTRQSEEVALAQTYADLRSTIADSLANGAIEIALVGDFDEEAAIDMVAQTLGALPQRNLQFLARDEARQRGFTQDRSMRTITHKGEPDQALLRLIWPTTDDSDLKLYLTMELLERLARLSLQEELRERLGQAYSPSANNAQSGVYPGYGTFSLTASLDVDCVDEARAAMHQVAERLRNQPVSQDTLERARKPLVESYENALKGNSGWLALIDRAQSKPEDIDRFLKAQAIVEAITAEDIQHAASKFLTQADAVEIRVVPEQSSPETP